ncbi:MAG: sigma-54-dependent Fis family transcriptional regulator [Deltaproteobacteria bacterium]|nr:MAG: sigma-54-dependent Fis family transcriptional regulator [Deltaproteobacteria bacterium]
MPRALIVDDDFGVQESLRMLLKEECDVMVARNVDEALARLDEAVPDLILLDLVMPGRNGMDLLRDIFADGAKIPVIVLTATQTVATAVEAMKLGAVDYLTKPFEVDALRLKVRRVFERRALEDEVARLRGEIAQRTQLGGIIGRCEPMQALFRTIERVAPSRANVLVTGESGSGKELVARALHASGSRAAGPFVAVNCAAIPESLIEAQLFGNEPGAFTDARERRIGKFEAAAGGTLFLDEIGELALPVQPKLLRTLQERIIERVGGNESIEVDVRIVAATNRDLTQDVARGRFRSDLYYRIHVVEIAVPPLRERRADIRLLAQRFLERSRAAEGRGPLRIAPETLAILERYDWPGNVRELENAIERAVALAEGDVLSPDGLPEAITRAAQVDGLREAVRTGRVGIDDAVARFERELLQEALEAAGWNQTRTAERLGITRRLLKLKMDRHGLCAPTRA